TLVFDDEFDSLNSIDVNNTGKAGFKWYVGAPEWEGLDKMHISPSAYTVANSVLNINKCPGGWAFTTYNFKNDLGKAFTYGYFEARFRFDPSLAPKASYYPGWGIFSVRHARVNNMDKWVGIDFFEAGTGGKHTYDSAFYGTVNEWIDSAQKHYQNSNIRQPLPKNTDLNAFHTYGCLWMPGKITWYFDGKALMTQTYGADKRPDPPDNNAPVGTFSILDREPQGMFLYLETCPEWPLLVDWVRVWQAKP
ncbi:MAG: family 16 glycosylhydrolase, partial [Chitinivibrionales bacterium]|nr:family 16 glycosylhydrolase [Chitinivibrionales bacterium]